ncbi:MAG: DNA polymerase III subunit delta' [Candidatus Poribacteria bacterium]
MFSDVIGHDNVIAKLKNIIKSGRIANAYIFAGPSNIGKEFVAVNFAKALNCKEFKGDCCDKCVSCRRIDDGNHTDVRIIRPEGAKLKIDQIRFLKRQETYKAIEGEYKVYIIVDAEKMTPESANSILKTLEEPSDKTIFILLTQTYNSLLPTIRSRCQLIRFSLVPQKILQKGLMNYPGMTEVSAKWLTIHSQGKPGKALKMASENISENKDDMTLILSILTQRNKSYLMNTFKKAEEISKLDNAIDTIISWYRDIILVKQGCPEELLIHSDNRQILEQLAKSYSIVELERLIDLALNLQNLIKRNINPVLALEILMFNALNALNTRL